MIVYEVNIEVREEAYADYRAWLTVHVEELLALPGFVAADILEQLEPSTREGMRALTVHYRLIDEISLKNYFAEHAPRMREDGVQRFGDAFTATRRVLVSSTRASPRRG